jgi:hypothetical protein
VELITAAQWPGRVEAVLLAYSHVGAEDYVLDEGTLMFKGRLIIQATFVVLVRLFYDNPRAGHDFYFELLSF